MKFILTLFAASITVIVFSVLWPYLTPTPRPSWMVGIRDKVVGTPLGQQVASVFGVTDESQVQPLTPQGVATTVTERASSTIATLSHKFIVTQLVNQLLIRYEQLSPDDQEVVRDAICTQKEEN